jgi:hypothetical protein
MKSDLSAPYAVHVEGEVNKYVDTLRPANSWVQRIYNREKPAPVPAVEISVTKEFEYSQIELRQRDPV